ncbi:hypothetical protein [Histidinibacterium aquaticum]|uniref:hypothetical protein n=1 Tax=Histidinibacterium aquaticum TaxID=2613962 RepID=UPI00168B763A|nr:hypothetical protein [Histidinibacterium aquaticum]
MRRILMLCLLVLPLPASAVSFDLPHLFYPEPATPPPPPPSIEPTVELPQQ